MRKPATRGTLEEFFVDIAIGAVLLMAAGIAVRFVFVQLDLISILSGK